MKEEIETFINELLTQNKSISLSLSEPNDMPDDWRSNRTAVYNSNLVTIKRLNSIISKY